MSKAETHRSASPARAPRVPPSRSLPASRWLDVDGPVHYLDWGGPAHGPALVLVHGLGGSVVNWAAVAPELARTCRVVAVDLVGFGRTELHGRSTRLSANMRLLGRSVEDLFGDQPVILVGNSMGGLISILLAHEQPALVAGLALIDPALPVGPTAHPDPLVTLMFGVHSIPAVSRLIMSRRRTFLSAEAQARALLRLCCVDPGRVPQDVLRLHLDLAREREAYPDVDAELAVAARSLVLVLARRREVDRVMHDLAVPVLLLHGDRDRLVPIQAARRVASANPTWRFEIAHDIGHVPQLEAPEWTLDHLLDWLAKDGAAAALAARP